MDRATRFGIIYKNQNELLVLFLFALVAIVLGVTEASANYFYGFGAFVAIVIGVYMIAFS